MLERDVLLRYGDHAWKDHLLALDHLKEGIGLRGYCQRDPLQEYKKEGYELFEALKERVEDTAIKTLFRMEPVSEQQLEEERLRRARRPGAAACVLRSAGSRSGIVFKSGGTTGNPKFSFFALDEWELFTRAFGEGMRKGGLETGERIANLFYAGDLYASFMFISKSIEKSNSSVVHYPLSGGAEFDHIIETMNSFKITTWAGVPTTIMKLTEYAQENSLHAPQKILFGGESM